LTEDTRGSLELLYDLTFDIARQVAASVVGEDQADDVAMDTMLRASDKLADGVPFEEVADLVPVIAYGIAVDEYRRLRDSREYAVDPKELRDTLAELEDNGTTLIQPGASLTGEEWRFSTDFDAALRSLTSDERDAFILTELRGLTVRDAAPLLGTSHMTVHRRAESARSQIREEIAA
jgi:RNA polymerase sigma factor (sigma-70 family)